MKQITVGTEYKTANGYKWGTVESISTITGMIRVFLADGSEREFGLAEANNWLRDGVLSDGKHYCLQCGEDMGNEWILGAVCGKCVRKNHRKACRK